MVSVTAALKDITSNTTSINNVEDLEDVTTLMEKCLDADVSKNPNVSSTFVANLYSCVENHYKIIWFSNDIKFIFQTKKGIE